MVSDPFLSVPKKKRSRATREDEEIDSDDYDSDDASSNKNKSKYEDDHDEDSEDDRKNESKTEKRRRLAKQYLEDLKHEEEIKESNYDNDDVIDTEKLTDFTFDAKDVDNDNISRRLQMDSIELKGNIYKFIGDRMKFAKKKCNFLNTDSYLLNPTSLAISYPNLYIVSKNMQLVKYDISEPSPKKLKYVNMKGNIEYHSDEITCVATNGKFVVTGSKDQSISIWDSANLTFLKNLPLKNKKASINSMVFRNPESNELYVASADLKIRIYNVMQFALIDTLYGHQDSIVDISSIGSAETAVTVGFRDKSAMLWKIPQQTRLTFNSNVSFEKFYNHYKQKNLGNESKEALKKKFVGEGSLDCVTMLDNTHFVTGSDNGNISLWTTQKKKPMFIHYQAHGYVPQLKPSEYTGDEDYIEEIESDASNSNLLLPPQQPYPISKVAAVPFSNIFVTGSYDSNLKIWQLDANLRGFHLLYELRGVKGIITDIEVTEITEDKIKYLVLLATVSKEHKLGRWLKKPVGAKNGIFKAKIKIDTSRKSKNSYDDI